MDKLTIQLNNCYGINKLDEQLSFNKNTYDRVYTIYAPNGLMKTSFAKSFMNISRGESPREERFNRQPQYKILFNENKIDKSEIYVLQSEIDIHSETESITDVLVNPNFKKEYDRLLLDVDKEKDKVIKQLSKISKVKKKDIESLILSDFGFQDFSNDFKSIFDESFDINLEKYCYETIFNDKTTAIINSTNFKTSSKKFTEKYNSLFTSNSSLYRKGVFNPSKAELSISQLNKNGYFIAGHKVYLNGDQNPLSLNEFTEKLNTINSEINDDPILKKLKDDLSKNAQTHALMTLFESLNAGEIDFLLENIKKENIKEFKKNIWRFYLSQIPESQTFLTLYKENTSELKKIEKESIKSIPIWTDAIKLFNTRFIDMPFKLSVNNLKEATLGLKRAQLDFTFKEGSETVIKNRAQINSLSQGEKRALYLLNFIFDVLVRVEKKKRTFFIIDDVADSFDYKNKHAIIQYLKDLTDHDFFYQLILTHNYDFFRSLANSFVNRNNCLMSNKNQNSISFTKAEGIKNYFIGKWKNQITNCPKILCATVPFTRNLIEYINDSEDSNYITLTNLLHWKENSSSITVGDYIKIYNSLFGKNIPTEDTTPYMSLLFEKAYDICNSDIEEGLNLENKVLLSMAIRILSESYILYRIRKFKGDNLYWCNKKNQFGSLMKEFKKIDPEVKILSVLEKVSITVSSNIHLNSFMYEPILDLSTTHLINLFNEVDDLWRY